MNETTTLRRLLAAILFLGMLGSATELLLLEHDEEVLQVAPLVLIGLAVVVLSVAVVRPSAAVVRTVQVTMLLFILAGVAGAVLHFRANMEFQQEMDPAIARWDLFWKVMHAKAPPALAPGVMVQLGLLGLVFSYRHPSIESPVAQSTKGRM
ncbi:MAG: hypothetical protein AB7I50_23275 [Vicinamibacterales bacterium]